MLKLTLLWDRSDLKPVHSVITCELLYVICYIIAVRKGKMTEITFKIQTICTYLMYVSYIF